jgi:hypothetical protein
MAQPSSDPYAAFGGQAITPPPAATPPPNADPYAAFGGSAITADQPAQPSLLERGVDAFTHLPGIQEVTGFMKGAEKDVAGLTDLASKQFLGPKPGETPALATRIAAAALPAAQATQALPESVRGPIRNAAAATADWLRKNTETHGWEKVGDIGESVGALMAVPEVDAELAGTKAATYGEKLVAKILDNPKLARVVRVGLNAAKGGARSGAEMAAQTAVRTGGDPEATTTAGMEGAAIGAPLAGAGAAVREVRGALNELRGGTREVAGATLPTLANGKLNLPSLDDVAVDPASAGADQAIGNIAKTGVRNSLARTLADRPAVREPITDPARMLPTPEGQKAGFRVATTEPTETVTQPSQEGRTALEDWYQTPEMETARPGSVQFQPPEGGGTVERGGGGHLIIGDDGQASSVARARYMLSTYDRIMEDPEAFNQLGIRQQDLILRNYDDLKEQLRRYDDFAASQPHFPAPDVADAVANSHDLGSAGQQLLDIHGAFWKKADELTGKEFSTLDSQRKALQASIRGTSATGDRLSKINDLMEVNDKLDQVFDKYRTEFSPAEWKTAKEGYQDGKALQELHNVMEAGFNGITKGEAAARPGLQRVFDPGQKFNQTLEKLYQKRGSVLERTIGREHMTDLKQLTQIFQTSERREASKTLLDYVGAAIRRHRYAIGGVTGGGLAYGLPHGIGTGLEAAGLGGLGIAAAGTVSGTLHYITDQLATNPAFAKRFVYAATNKVSPRIAAPLLTSMLLNSNQQPKPKTSSDSQQQPATSTGEQQ